MRMKQSSDGMYKPVSFKDKFSLLSSAASDRRLNEGKYKDAQPDLYILMSQLAIALCP